VTRGCAPCLSLHAVEKVVLMSSESLWQTLSERGLIAQSTGNRADMEAALACQARFAVYAGFDPTADSLHVGHLLTLSVLREFARAGHRVIAVIGTATALVGDPTGRSEARPLLDETTVSRNAAGVETSIRAALSPFSDKVEIRRNGEWFVGMGWMSFLRDVGRLVSVNRVLALESVKARLEADGMSFLELAYPLMQAYDFLTLHREVGPLIQVGGSDQWGNIVAGHDLIARSGGGGGGAMGMTHPLLTRADGVKMGKTAGGAVWLNRERLSDFGFFQFWRTAADADAVKMARMISDLDSRLADAAEGGLSHDAETLKAALAFSMTERIRGAASAAAAAAASCGRGAVAEGLPEVWASLGEAADLPLLMVRAGLAGSKAAARRLAAQGGLRVNNEARASLVLTDADISAGVVVLSSGRTRHCAIRLG
jgi:tyrosyl-tRNA synthetase